MTTEVYGWSKFFLHQLVGTFFTLGTNDGDGMIEIQQQGILLLENSNFMSQELLIQVQRLIGNFTLNQMYFTDQVFTP